MTLFRHLVALAAALVATAAAAQTNVPPPPRATPAASTAPRPSTPALTDAQRYDVANALDRANTGTKVIVDGSAVAGKATADALLKKSSSALGVVGHTLKLNKAISAEPGRKTWEATGDFALGACIDLACYATGVTGGLCSAAAQVALACVDGASEAIFDQSIGGALGGAMYDAKTWATGADEAPVAPEPDRRSALRERFGQTQASNREYAARAPPPSSGGGYDDGDDGGAAFAQLLGALNQQMAAPMTPMTPATPAASGACHSGHDEKAHPGGCHDANGVN